MSICRFQFKARGKQYVLASEHDEEVARLKAEVERLRKAGDAMAEELIGCYRGEGYDPADSETLTAWFAAKWTPQP